MCVKRLPNILSCCRIILSLVLLLLFENPTLFLIVYLLCGMSDIADGYLARKLDARTVFGAKLDSVGDFIFFGVTIFVAFSLIDRKALPLLLFVVIGVALIRAMNFAITRHKFHQWGIVHTIGNKATGFALFAALPICIFIGQIPAAIIFAIGGIGAFSALEETCILLTEKTYDVNRKSFFICRDKGPTDGAA